jgi:beta-aspartyl-peptidase (threonine type)
MAVKRIGRLGAQRARRRFVLAIHGGAETIRPQDFGPDEERSYHAALEAALESGFEILRRKGSSIDAVQAAVQVLEDSPLFNAGRGAVFTTEGTIELDAAIMDGDKLKAGAVAGLKYVKNPVALARLVMERTPHVMLVASGAEAFARAVGVPMVSEKYFFTDRSWKALQRAKVAGRKTWAEKYGTVGAVARDSHGRLAAATSTGGFTNKLPGRVGDSPVIGAGTYANDWCAVSTTGDGEHFIRNVVAYDICARMQYGARSLAQAVEEVFNDKLGGPDGGKGGVIAVDMQGNVVMPFNTEGMYRGYIGPTGKPQVRMYR